MTLRATYDSMTPRPPSFFFVFPLCPCDSVLPPYSRQKRVIIVFVSPPSQKKTSPERPRKGSLQQGNPLTFTFGPRSGALIAWRLFLFSGTAF